MPGKNENIHSLLIDTCVWLDLAKDPSNEPIIIALKYLVEAGVIKLLIPVLIKEEFERNKDRVVEASRQRLSQEFKRIKKVVEKFGELGDKAQVIGVLDDVHHKIPILTDAVFETIGKIEDLFSNCNLIETTEKIKIKAAERAIKKEAPFHKNKNNMADAIILEILFDELSKNDKNNYSFITHNTKDFSSSSDNRTHHEDFDKIFSLNNISYNINLVNVLKEIDPEILNDYIAEHEWADETRGLYEILEHIDILIDKVWFNRHCIREEAIADGRIKLVEKEKNIGYQAGTIQRDIWNGALAAAESVKENYPGELGPWTDFEWGMLNGKLSALRWVLGDEWDMLDT